ncbi:hypothetical protein M422DRAFT_274810 [Sphaerobolus stellatus SS14]|uniref:C3H1-type domain-containing protein n=1 Tax=Sphaerobolus stellatus (strain SS14) TaxID=990650 RepID=A0A0C9TRC3_SPHS4|nr:hypothetical protein M422DRAFT_274810 [Sphaerobolus stellatus SS14]
MSTTTPTITMSTRRVLTVQSYPGSTLPSPTLTHTSAKPWRENVIISPTPRISRSRPLDARIAPPFPDGLWHDVIVGNFVDLDKIHAQRDSLEGESEYIQTIGGMEFRVRDCGSIGKPSKTIKSHSDWIIAFQSAKAAILFVYPGRKEEFEAYETFMAGQFAAVRPEEHHRVIALDKAIRKQASRVNNYTLLTLPNFQALCTQQLNPIGRGSDYTAGSNYINSAGKRRRDDDHTKPICRRFNRDNCIGPCRFRHICSLCKDKHQAKNCPSSRKRD